MPATAFPQRKQTTTVKIDFSFRQFRDEASRNHKLFANKKIFQQSSALTANVMLQRGINEIHCSVLVI